MDHKEHIDEVAQIAATLHGQDWARLPQWSKDRWREAVRHAVRGNSGVNEMERHAEQAIGEWYKRKEAADVTPEPVEAPPETVETEAAEASEPPKRKPRSK